MKNNYNDKDARTFVRRQVKCHVNKDLALCIYGSQLLGQNNELVMHGGGNSSVKISNDILYVKGSGSDMAFATPDNFPALDLKYLTKKQSLGEVSDGELITILRRSKLNPDAIDPSVETLVHAFLPDKFVYHTHANSILALSNQPNGLLLCKSIFGNKAEIIPYSMSGFELAKKVISERDRLKDCHGIVCMKHGIFSFGTSAKEAYDNMINLVNHAEKALILKSKKKLTSTLAVKTHTRVEEILPIIRGGLGPGWILSYRTSKLIKTFMSNNELRRYGMAGPVTPDHVIWIGHKPLILTLSQNPKESFEKIILDSIKLYKAQSERRFLKHNLRYRGQKIIKNKTPRVILIPGIGLVGVGKNINESSIAADLAEVNIRVISDAEAIGTYSPASKRQIFDVEYWAPEANKIKERTSLPLGGKIVLITGGGSGIGAATAGIFSKNGAVVALVDKDLTAAELVASKINGYGFQCDVTSVKDVKRTFDKICKKFGGVDIIVSNAGAAWQGEIGTVDNKIIRDSFELNFFAHQNIAQNAVRIMRAQKLGGSLLFNTSKQAINPGPDFGPYGLPKAATLFLMRQYAVDHSKDGITSNAVNADRIRSGLLTSVMIEKRSKARKLSEADYMQGNLLGIEVNAEDVGEAFLALALSPKTTASVFTVDGGNIAAALR